MGAKAPFFSSRHAIPMPFCCIKPFVTQLIFLVACLLTAGSALAQLPPPINQALKTAQIPAANLGLIVQAVDAPHALLSHNANQAMNPASVMKLVTTYAALELLGPAHTWQTTLLSENVAVDGQIRGNLYLQGSGDPRLTREHLWLLLRQLRVRGIEQILGDIVVDRSIFAAEAFNPAAFDNKPLRAYNVGPNGLLIDFQALRFTLQPGMEDVNLWLETPIAGLSLNNRLRLQQGACPADWRDRINMSHQPETGQLLVTGSYAQECGERSLNLAPLSADQHADGLLRHLWQEMGGQLSGKVRHGSTPATSVPLARHESAPLTEIIRDINKLSNNVMARQVFLSLDEGQPASSQGAGERIQHWLKTRKLDFPELVVDNGSGLSRQERISAGNMNRLLIDAWRNPLMPEFIASLPLSGIDGTMKKRLNGSPATGRAHIKTGTLNGVRTAAGYLIDQQGQRYALTIFINDPRAAEAAPVIDALLNWLAAR